MCVDVESCNRPVSYLDNLLFTGEERRPWCWVRVEGGTSQTTACANGGQARSGTNALAAQVACVFLLLSTLCGLRTSPIGSVGRGWPMWTSSCSPPGRGEWAHHEAKGLWYTHGIAGVSKGFAKQKRLRHHLSVQAMWRAGSAFCLQVFQPSSHPEHVVSFSRGQGSNWAVARLR